MALIPAWSPAANDITPFRAIMNDMYAKDISKKIKSVKRDKQRKGQFIGGKPMYGYKMHPTEKNRIVVDEEAACSCAAHFRSGAGGASAAGKSPSRLNEAHIPTPAAYAGLTMGNKGPYAGLWSSRNVSPRCCKTKPTSVNMVQGRTQKVSYKSKKCITQDPLKIGLWSKYTHEPLIDEETFPQGAACCSNSRKHTRSRTYDFLLKGLICCHERGYPTGRHQSTQCQRERTGLLLCLPHLSAVYQGGAVYLPFHQGADGDGSGRC